MEILNLNGKLLTLVAFSHVFLSFTRWRLSSLSFAFSAFVTCMFVQTCSIYFDQFKLDSGPKSERLWNHTDMGSIFLKFMAWLLVCHFCQLFKGRFCWLFKGKELKIYDLPLRDIAAIFWIHRKSNSEFISFFRELFQYKSRTLKTQGYVGVNILPLIE